jgi:hypothetical protein
MLDETIAGMIHSLLKFAWIAFREYWGVWVTGTGLTGLLLWALNYLQVVTGWKMRPRHYAMVLFCVFWFLATYSAWRDSDRNLQSVARQRAEDTSHLSVCNSDLKVAQAQTAFFEKQANLGLTNFAVQQQTLNSCVLSLGIANKRSPLTITVKEAPFSASGASQHFGQSSPSALVMETNQIVTPTHGTLKCSAPFMFVDVDFAMGPHFSTYEKKQMIGPDKARIEIESPAWSPGTPLVALVVSKGDLSPCEFVVDAQR